MQIEWPSSLQNAASQLDKLINRWASDIVRVPPAPATAICAAILNDLVPGLDLAEVDVTPMQLQCYLRHALSESISEGIINCLIVTNSMEANVQLTRVHEHLFARMYCSFSQFTGAHWFQQEIPQ